MEEGPTQKAPLIKNLFKELPSTLSAKVSYIHLFVLQFYSYQRWYDNTMQQTFSLVSRGQSIIHYFLGGLSLLTNKYFSFCVDNIFQLDTCYYQMHYPRVGAYWVHSEMKTWLLYHNVVKQNGVQK